MSSVSLPAEAAAGLSTRWQVTKKHEGVYTDSAAKVSLAPLTGDFLATWCAGDVSLLHLSTGSMMGKISASSEDVEDQFSSFSIEPNEKFIATISRKSQMIKIHSLDAIDGEFREVTSWKCAHQLPVLDMAYSPTGMDLATCSADKSIVVYSVKRAGVVTHRFAPSPSNTQKPGHKSRVVHVFWHPSPKRMEIISCAEDGEMRIWKLSDGSSTLLSNHMSLVTSVAFSKDGNTLISGGRDKVINVWSLAPSTYGHHLRTLPVYELVEGITILDGRPACAPKADNSLASDIYFTTAGSKGSLRTWSLSTLDLIHSVDLPRAAIAQGTSSEQVLENAEKNVANQCAHLIKIPARQNKEGQQTEERLIAVTQEQNFYVYSTSSFTRLQLLLGFNDEIIDLRAHPDNRHVLLASNSSQIRIMDLENLSADLISGHTDTVLALDLSPCGQYVVSSSKDSTVRFWKLDWTAKNNDEKAICIAIGQGHTESVGCVTFSRNKHTGKLFAVSGARERIMKLWDCSSFKTMTAVNSKTIPVRLTALTSRLAHEKDINCLECSPNDKFVASGSEDKSIRIWNCDDLSPKSVLKGHKRGVWSIRFSPVDKVLASASGDKTIKLWSMDDFSCLKTLESHTASVKQVMFINSGMQLLSCGDDAVVKLWTIKTSECVGTFEDAHDGKIWAMAITPDQKRLVTGGSDSVVNIWADVSAADIEEEQAKRETFLLQEQELTNLIRHKRYTDAVSMCLTLEQPRKAYTIVQELMVQENKERDGAGETNEANGAVSAASQIAAIVAGLDEEQLNKLVLYIRDWNTHAKQSHVAQMLLSHLFRSLPPSRLQGVRSLIQQSASLNLYSDRHFNRIDKLLTKSYIMDYMLNAMKAVEPNVDSEAEQKKRAEEESNRVVKQLLASAPAASSPAIVSKSTPLPLAPAPAVVSDDDGGFSDDDDAWATNWKDDNAEPTIDHTEKTKANTTTTTTKATGAKRKEPPTNEVASEHAKKQKPQANKSNKKK